MDAMKYLFHELFFYNKMFQSGYSFWFSLLALIDVIYVD